MIRPLLAAATLLGLLPVVLSQWDQNACYCGDAATTITMTSVKICSWGLLDVPYYPGNDCTLMTLPFGSCTQYFNCVMKCICYAQWFPPSIDSVPHMASWHFVGPSQTHTNQRLLLEYWADDGCEWPSLTPVDAAGNRGYRTCSEFNGWIMDWPTGLAWPPRTGFNPGRGTNELPSNNETDWYDIMMAENLQKVQQWDEAQMAFDALDSDDPAIDKEFVQDMIRLRNLTRPSR